MLPSPLSLLHRKMLTKDKKPETAEGKKAEEVIPPPSETPKLFKAALVVTEQAGIKGTFAKLKEKEEAGGLEVRIFCQRQKKRSGTVHVQPLLAPGLALTFCKLHLNYHFLTRDA